MDALRFKQRGRSLSFFIPGTPVGKGRMRVQSTKGGPVHFMAAKTRNYQAHVSHETHAAMNGQPLFECPLAIRFIMAYPVPTSWPAWKQEAALIHGVLPTTKPDIDNVVKAILDGMNEVAFADDRQVIETHCLKLYSEKPGVMVNMQEVDAAPMAIKSRKAFQEWMGVPDDPTP